MRFRSRWAIFRERRLPFWLRYFLAKRRGRLDEIKQYQAERKWRKRA